MKSFKELGLSPQTLEVLARKGFEEPTPIQEKTIPLILTGEKDIVGQAQTGTGKTAAFGLPILELLVEKSKTVQCLILTPTRELAIQVAQELVSFKGKKRLTIVPIYGGQSINLQLRQLQKGVDIVVGTPGRIIDHINRKTLNLKNISHLVLDEADEMLNMGFIDDVETILQQTPKNKQTLLFSATMPKEILTIAQKHMGEYDLIKVTPDQITVSQTDQIYFEVSEADKFEALCRIIDIEETFYGLIFCRTKIDVDAIANRLMERGYDADALHGDMSQSLREKILTKFKKRLINILVATDVAARGIDVQDLTHVINYSLPQDPRSYVHRIGRTGRAGKEGNAITFVTPEEYRRLHFIRRQAKTDIRKAKLPKVQDIISTKKERIKSSIETIAQTKVDDAYQTMARDLLEKNDPEKIVAALLQQSFQEELNEKNYAAINENVLDRKGKTRLFVTWGKQAGLTKEKLIQYIQESCDITTPQIHDIAILDKFSFVTLPFHEAEIVLAHFKKKRRGSGGPTITKAKTKR